MDSPKQRAIEALEKALKPLIDAHNAATDRFGEDDAGAANIFTGIDCISQALSAFRSQPDHGVPDALISAGDAMRRSLLGAIPVGPLDKWELDAFNALSDWDAAKAAAPRPHREPSVEEVMAVVEPFLDEEMTEVRSSGLTHGKNSTAWQATMSALRARLTTLFNG